MRTAAAARPTIGDRATSDVVVRLRTPEGRDEWLYCHSAVLAAGSGYFADRLSDAWPTCQILDSRYCVEVRCADPDLSSHVNALRLLYPSAGHDPVSRFGVRGALALLRAAAHLACGRIAAACADYLESAPWDEADEEEILAAVPCLAGDQYDRVLARLRPADPAPATAIFLSAFRHATAPAAAAAASRELKSAAQEQLEYMLTEDDDAPLLAFDADGGSGAVKSQVKDCVAGLLNRFSDFTSSVLTKQMEAPCSSDGELQQELHSFVSDISWVCQVLGKLEMMKCLAAYWIGASSDVVAAVEVACPGSECLKTRMKVVEISAKVLEAVAFGNVVLPPEKRCHAVNVWIRFAGITKHFVNQANRGNGEETHNGDDGESHNGDEGNNGDAEAAAKIGLDREVWQGLESAITSIVMTLPSNPQAEILSEWLQSKHAAFLDLTEAFDAWCYRSKVAGRRLSFLNNSNLTS